MQWTVQYRQMPKVLLRIIQHQHLAQVLSHFRHEEVMNNPIRLMRIQNITCHYYVLVCKSQTMRPCNRHSNQYAPLQQQVQDPLQENHESPPQQWNPNGFDAVLDNGERREMYDGPDGGPTTTEQGHRRYTPWRSCTSAPVHNGELYWIFKDRHANNRQENEGS